MNKVELINVSDDVVRFECVECGVQQEIVATHEEVQSMASDIVSGINPFADGWEDGIGNTITCDCE